MHYCNFLLSDFHYWGWRLATFFLRQINTGTEEDWLDCKVLYDLLYPHCNVWIWGWFHDQIVELACNLHSCQLFLLHPSHPELQPRRKSSLECKCPGRGRGRGAAGLMPYSSHPERPPGQRSSSASVCWMNLILTFLECFRIGELSYLRLSRSHLILWNLLRLTIFWKQRQLLVLTGRTSCG